MLQTMELNIPNSMCPMTTESYQEKQQKRCDEYNSTVGKLSDYDCPICKNKGHILTVGSDGDFRMRDCQCQQLRKSKKLLNESGIANLMERYTFDSFKELDAEAAEAKSKALDYIKNGNGKWFYISGRPGSGKTHICTAVCGALLATGKSVRYMVWRDVVRDLKAAANTDDYRPMMASLTSMDVLYIDDFFKGNVTEADVNIAFELLNARYNSTSKQTIISSERTPRDLLTIDEAVGSRIYERSRGYCLQAPNKNRRLGQ